MSEDREQPEFYAWVDEANAEDAYLATLSTLLNPAVFDDERMRGSESDYSTSSDAELAVRREAIRHGCAVLERVPIILRPRELIIEVGIMCRFPSDHRGGVPGCLLSVDYQHSHVMPEWTEIPVSQGALSVPVQAAILGLFGQENIEKVFLGMCAPDAHSRVKVGGYNMVDKLYDRLLWSNCAWRAPLEMAATYHGDHVVARDVAISWLYLHDGEFISSVVDLSTDALRARVNAAPARATVGISSLPRHVIKHAVDESNHAPSYELRTPLNTLRGPRALFPEDDVLTREQVLTTLQTPSETLLQALEAAAAPDAEWVEAEKQALDVLAARKEGEPREPVKIDQLDQRNFLEAHAPYHVRRLPNGGVMLATHPYRYLWPFWAKALDLLGIRKLNA